MKWRRGGSPRSLYHDDWFIDQEAEDRFHLLFRGGTIGYYTTRRDAKTVAEMWIRTRRELRARA